LDEHKQLYQPLHVYVLNDAIGIF